jgi:two-component system cell cycle response regulator
LQTEGPTAPPVIFLTARGAASDRVAGLDLGAVDYVVKPFDAAELTARVRVALRQKAARDALAAEAATDGLTGLLNRRELDARAAELIALSRRYSRPLSCLMIDVDHFKQINDAYGHAAGDEVLRQVARRIRAGCRVSDVAGRYGGEEFTLLLPDTDIEGAVAVAEKLRGAVSAEPVRAAIADSAMAEAGAVIVDVNVRVSVGVAVRQPTMLDPESLYAAADNALYRAKQAGRDQVSVAPTSGAPTSGGPA